MHKKTVCVKFLTTEKFLREELLTALSVADDKAKSDAFILNQTQKEKEKIALAKSELEEKSRKEQEQFRLKLYISFGFILLFAAFGYFMFRSRRKIVAQKTVIEKSQCRNSGEAPAFGNPNPTIGTAKRKAARAKQPIGRAKKSVGAAKNCS